MEVDNLPGDVNQYYGMLANNGEDTSGAQYTVQYYYVAGSGGADGASARTIHRILTEPDAGYAGFSYAYSVRLYIANIRNGFLVAKNAALDCGRCYVRALPSRGHGGRYGL